jgi:hypothetical protein
LSIGEDPSLITIEHLLFGSTEGDNRSILETRFKQLMSSFDGAPTLAPDPNQYASRADLRASFNVVEIPNARDWTPHENQTTRVFEAVARRGVVGNAPLASSLCLPLPNNENLALKLETIAAFGVAAALFVANKWGLGESGTLTTARAIGTALRHLASINERDLLRAIPDFSLEPAILFPILAAQRKASKKAGNVPQALKLLSELDDKLRFHTRPKHAAGRGVGRVVTKSTSRKLIGTSGSYIDMDAPPKQKKAKNKRQARPPNDEGAGPVVPQAPPEPTENVDPQTEPTHPIVDAPPREPPFRTDPPETPIMVPLVKPGVGNRRPIQRVEKDEADFATETKPRVGSERGYGDDEPKRLFRAPMRTIRGSAPKQHPPSDGLVETSDALWHGRAKAIAHNIVRREHFLPCATDFVTLPEGAAIFRNLIETLENLAGSEAESEAAFEVLLVLLLGRTRSQISAFQSASFDDRIQNWSNNADEVALSIALDLPDKNITKLDQDFLLPLPAHALLLQFPDHIQKGVRALIVSQSNLFRTDEAFYVALKVATQVIGRPITEAMLARFLPAYFAADSTDKALSGWILGDRLRDKPMLSYARYPISAYQAKFESAARALGQASVQLTEPDRESELGTALVPAPESLTALFFAMRQDINSLTKEINPDYIAVHNNLTIYVVTLLMLATGHRPVRDPFDCIASFDVEHGICFISDKEIRGSNSARWVFLPQIARDQLTAYLEHLDRLSVLGASDQHPIGNRAGDALNGRRTLFFLFRGLDEFRVSPATLLEEMKDVWALQANWPRHTLRALILKGFEPEIIDAIMGHDGDGVGHLSADSGIAWASLKGAAEHINQFFVRHEMEVAHGLTAGRGWSLRLPELLPPSKTEGRALKKRNREVLDFEIRQAVDNALVEAGLFTRLSLRKVEPTTTLIDQWDGLVARIAAGIESGTIPSGKTQAYSHLAVRARQMAELSGRDLKVPSAPFSIPTPASLYTETMTQASQAIAAWHAAFVVQLEGLQEGEPTNSKMRALALYSAITNGFLFKPNGIVALELQLRQGRVDFMTTPDDQVVILLPILVVRGACNWADGDQGFEYVSFIPDALTLNLIVRTLETAQGVGDIEPPNQLDKQVMRKAIFKLIATTLFENSLDAPKAIASLRALCDTGFVPLEVHGLKVPQGLRCALNGKNQSFGPDPIALALLCNQEPEPRYKTYVPSVCDETRTTKSDGEQARPDWQRYADALQRMLAFNATTANDRQKGKAVVGELEALLAFPFDGSHARLLVEWLYELLSRFKRKYSTFRRYVSPLLGLYLTEFDGVDLQSLDGDDLLEHYTNIIDQKRSPISQAYVANRLAQLHRFGVHKGHWGLAPLSEQLGDDASSIMLRSYEFAMAFPI